MKNIKQLIIALAMAVTTTTTLFAMKNDSIYDNAKYIAGKTFHELIDEAAKAQLPGEEYKQFIEFVHAFPTKELNPDLIQEKGKSHPQYEKRVFFKGMARTVAKYAFSDDIAMTPKGVQELNDTAPSTFAKFDLYYAIHRIVERASR